MLTEQWLPELLLWGDSQEMHYLILKNTEMLQKNFLPKMWLLEVTEEGG